jgi:peptidoglycan/xylan/chitin deacetylase (PgdA/CDA1 family)
MWNDIFKRFALEAAYFSGAAYVSARRRGGAGVILKFNHVAPRRSEAFQPLASTAITPRFLDRAVTALKRWKYAIVSIDEAIVRSQEKARERFVVLTFDGAHSDFATHAYPILRRHEVPYALYIPTGFVDGIGEPWWLALEKIVADNPRVIMMMDSEERRFASGSVEEKRDTYAFIDRWLRLLPPDELSVVIGDLCARYGVDLTSISKAATMTWQDLNVLAADPLVTIGSATVNYPVLSRTDAAAALRQMKMGRATLESALGRPCVHFAYPFGDQASFGSRDEAFASEAGFATAVTSVAGMVPTGACNLMALPRLEWDGRVRSIRRLRFALSGTTMPRQRN